MQLSHIPLPSFTLVLTSGHCSLYGDPIPTVPDHLMKTIDLRYVPIDDNSAYHESSDGVGVNVDTETLFKLERPATSGGAKRARNVSIENFVILIRKLLSLKYKFMRN